MLTQLPIDSLKTACACETGVRVLAEDDKSDLGSSRQSVAGMRCGNVRLTCWPYHLSLGSKPEPGRIPAHDSSAAAILKTKMLEDLLEQELLAGNCSACHCKANGRAVPTGSVHHIARAVTELGRLPARILTWKFL